MQLSEFADKNMKIATAESCTGGMLANLITSVPGASRYYLGGIVSYSNEAKINILKVRRETIVRYGAVSEECAKEMAYGAAKIFGADAAIATTGIAGPGGGTPDKPVGTVYIACYHSGKITVHREKFNGSREEIKEKAAKKAIKTLEEMLGGK